MSSGSIIALFLSFKGNTGVKRQRRVMLHSNLFGKDGFTKASIHSVFRLCHPDFKTHRATQPKYCLPPPTLHPPKKICDSWAVAFSMPKSRYSSEKWSRYCKLYFIYSTRCLSCVQRCSQKREWLIRPSDGDAEHKSPSLVRSLFVSWLFCYKSTKFFV